MSGLETEKDTARDTGRAASDGYEALRLDRQLCFALYSASAMFTRLYRPLLDPLGLTYPQYITMLVLWERAPLPVGDIGAALGLDSATLTPLLKRLETAGYVSRTRDPADERRVLVAPTQAGTELRERVVAMRDEMLCRLPVGAERLSELHELLNELNAAFRSAPGTREN